MVCAGARSVLALPKAEIDTSPREITMEPGNPLEPDGDEFRRVSAAGGFDYRPSTRATIC